jgi:acyl-CoA synthetase (AMP-forming)/AMP-acid ligase II
MLGPLVGEAARRFGEQPAFVSVVDPTRALSYLELDRLSDEVAAGLARRGVREGDRIALVLPPAVEYPVLYLAAAKLGAMTAGLNARLPAPQQSRLLELLRPRLVVTEGAAPAGPWEPVSVSTAQGPPLAALRVPDGAPPPLRPDPDRPVAVVFTSGTTGLPKGAVFTNRQIAAVTGVDVGDTWGGGGRSIASTSFAHVGPMTKLAGSLRRGGTTYIAPRWRADDALDLVGRLGVSSIGGIPTQIALMLASPRLAATDLSSVRLLLVGGAPATASLLRSARQEFGAPVCVRYSCTEAGVGCGTRPEDPPSCAESSVGRPQPGVSLAVRDADGSPRGVGEVGQVLLRSDAVMSGYLDDPEATAAAFTADGYVRTGDLGWVDEEGLLHLVGRSKEMYIRGGYNVYPVEVEAALAELPAVRDVAVVPIPDAVMGEVGVAVVVPDPTRPRARLEDLRAHGGASLPWYALPDRLLFAEQLPLTPGDKIDRAALLRLVEESSSLTDMSGSPSSGRTPA